MADDKPIIIVKKKGGHGGHHGGAWKVAYADFVTAMMAFFMVMWLVNSAEVKTKTSIASYFRRPGIFQTGSGTPLLIGESGILPDAYAPSRPDAKKDFKSGSDNAPVDKRAGADREKIETNVREKDHNALGVVRSKEKTEGVKVEVPQDGGASVPVVAPKPADLQQQLEALSNSLAEAVKKQIESIPTLKELLGLVEVRVEADGLTIEIMDTEKYSMFASGSARILPGALAPFRQIATILEKLPNKIDIQGHTDSKPFATRGGMTNWELSSDRANAARRIMEQFGYPSDRITSVIGRADRDLKVKTDPYHTSNRRITMKVQFDMEELGKRAIDKSGMRGLDDLVNNPTVGVEAIRPTVEAAQPSAAPRETAQATPIPSDLYYKTKHEVKAKEDKNTIPLPQQEPMTGDVKPPEPKIFKDDPVLGPPDPFVNF